MRARCVLLLGVFFLGGLERGNGGDSASPGDVFKRAHSSTDQQGVTFAAEYTGEVFGNLTGGIKTGATYEALLKVALQLDLGRMAGWDGATIYGSMFYPHGEGLTDRFTGDFNRLSSIDAYDSVRLFELWFQQKIGETSSRSESVRCQPTWNSINRQAQIYLLTVVSELSRPSPSELIFPFTRWEESALESIIDRTAVLLCAQDYSIPTREFKT